MTGARGGDFLGCGWRFPVQRGPSGGVATSAGLASIEESIRIIIATAPGERLHRPAFGCRLHELLFAPNNGRTRSLACHFVQTALLRWEPRIRDVRVVALPVRPRPPGGASGADLELSVSYVVRATNHPGNLVHPFSLDPGAHS